MTDSHLNNTIKMLERFKQQKESYIVSSGYQYLCTMQGEMAIEHLERELDYIENFGLDMYEVHPLYENLILEQERRST